MKNSQTSAPAITADMDLWGQTLAAQLNVSAQDVGHDIGERLRVARQTALKSRPMPQRLMRHSLAVQANGTLSGLPDEGLNLWRILGSALPLLALVLGLNRRADELLPCAHDFLQHGLGAMGIFARAHAHEAPEIPDEMGLVVVVAVDRAEPTPLGQFEEREQDAMSADDPEQVKATQGIE